ncbi:uncharacterized protein LOC108672721 isoform X1 [Hyalella azteca]|uniref:Uncharacterized protein LOC108672721 isoform X1 n=1 Tax=Hyalella azteca TaxID=294128 RepID=A0A8B7NSB4_HYAAZ|nr:uncharacterized protein LOC108672721 isoform X1 [Hyalella azteca]
MYYRECAAPLMYYRECAAPLMYYRECAAPLMYYRECAAPLMYYRECAAPLMYYRECAAPLMYYRECAAPLMYYRECAAPLMYYRECAAPLMYYRECAAPLMYYRECAAPLMYYRECAAPLMYYRECAAPLMYYRECAAPLMYYRECAAPLMYYRECAAPLMYYRECAAPLMYYRECAAPLMYYRECAAPLMYYRECAAPLMYYRECAAPLMYYRECAAPLMYYRECAAPLMYYRECAAPLMYYRECAAPLMYYRECAAPLMYYRECAAPLMYYRECAAPLMYYLCLSTVDRRSRDRFIDSNNQIAALVERFKVEGGPFRKYAGPIESDPQDHKVPLFSYGQPGVISVMLTLFWRSYSLMLPNNRAGAQDFFLRLLLLPSYFFLLWNFYFPLQSTQRSFQTRGGLVFNCVVGTAFLAAAATATTFSGHRTRYYHEARSGLYRGPLFLVSYFCFAAPIAFLSVMAASAIVFFGLGLTTEGRDPGATDPDWLGWLLFGSVLWAAWGFVEQQTIALMLIVRSSYCAASASVALTSAYLLVGAATLRSLVGIPDWLYYLSHVNVFKFAAAALQQQLLWQQLPSLPVNETITCPDNNAEFGCRYRNGTYYLLERYHVFQGGVDLDRQDLDFFTNVGFSFIFYAGMLIGNLVLYLIPLPAFIKTKFRE